MQVMGGVAAVSGFLFLAAAAHAASGPDALSRKVGSRLRQPPAKEARARTGLVAAEPWRDGSRVHVYVRVASADEATVDALRRAGLEIVVVVNGFNLVDGWAEQARIADIAALPEVHAIRPVAPPVTQTGSIVSEGDVPLRSDVVRAVGFSGAGVTVGLISDGIDSLANSQATGDLPPGVGVPPDPRCQNNPGDEGTAMLEIVHDVAPGAGLLFSSLGSSGAEMGEAVRCLADAGSTVIVDDITFPDEPFFQDGPLALAAREVVARGVSYHTSAGNRRQEFVEQPFAGVFAGQGVIVHDWGQGTGDTGNDVTLAANDGATCVIQWDEPFGAAATDFDLFLAQGATVIASSDDPQDGTQDPIEIVNVNNPTDTDQVARIVVQFFSGDPQRTLRLVCFRSLGLEVRSTEGVIYGQQSPPEVIALASIFAGDEGHDTIEDASSPGPAKIFFPAFELRQKPDVATFDGVNTTVPGFQPFFGTSAAAPHSAGVAALMLSKNLGLSPAQIQTVMKQTAIDIEAPGFDFLAGAGRIDAAAAVGAIGCLEVARIPETPPCTAPQNVTKQLKGARRKIQQADGAQGKRVLKLAKAARKQVVKGLRALGKSFEKGRIDAGCAAFFGAAFTFADNAANCRLRSAGG